MNGVRFCTTYELTSLLQFHRLWQKTGDSWVRYRGLLITAQQCVSVSVSLVLQVPQRPFEDGLRWIKCTQWADITANTHLNEKSPIMYKGKPAQPLFAPKEDKNLHYPEQWTKLPSGPEEDTMPSKIVCYTKSWKSYSRTKPLTPLAFTWSETQEIQGELSPQRM